jgi:hypothetical protein
MAMMNRICHGGRTRNVVPLRRNVQMNELIIPLMRQLTTPPKKQPKIVIPSVVDNLSSSSEDESNEMSNNQYMQRPPSGGMFNDGEIVKFFDSYPTASQHMDPVRMATNLSKKKI